MSGRCIQLALDINFPAGNVDLGLYKKNCLFADPTISFRGRGKYSRNLQTLKAFFIDPTIQLYSLVENGGEHPSLKAGQYSPSFYHRILALRALLPTCTLLYQAS